MTQPQLTPAALLTLADGRFPAGGHAHSGGIEVAVADGAVHDLGSLTSFLLGRLHTVGLTQAALSAAACDTDDPAELDSYADARHPAAVQRRISRAQGRAVLRAGRAAWPAPVLEALATDCPDGPHQAVAFGAVAAAAGLRPEHAALASAHGAVTGPASAALRLLGLDPYGVHGVVARLGADCERVAAAAAEYARGCRADLPAATGPLIDIAAIRHEHWELRLFAS
ncbi:MAG TPA: urease accessory UreF family protein [Sporichthyaceae bacterium]